MKIQKDQDQGLEAAVECRSLSGLNLIVSNVTRLVIIKDTNGRVIDSWDVKLELSLQDDGRTLKVFVRDRE